VSIKIFFAYKSFRLAFINQKIHFSVSLLNKIIIQSSSILQLEH